MLKSTLKFYNDLKIAKKLKFLSISTTLISGITIIILLETYQFFLEKKSVVQEANTFAKILADNIAPSIKTNNVLAISNTLASIEYNNKIRQTFALDISWKILGAFHQGNDFSQKRQIVSLIRENKNIWKDGFFYSVVPIIDESVQLGYLVVVASLHDFYLNVIKNSIVILVIILLTLLLTYRLRKTLQESILVPISKLDTITTNVVKTKNLHQNIPIFHNDEIGDLARNFNHMLTELNIYQNELNAQKDILAYQANHDSLTKLPNRELFNDRLHQTIYKAARENKQFALFFIDLDQFKEVNDTYGHDYGDALLQEIAKRLKNIIREEDTLARLGGDEFTIILQNLKDPIDASKIAQIILNALQNPIEIYEQIIRLSCSIGISLYPQDSLEATDLIKSADIAMYRSKEQGRNRYHFYEEEMAEKILIRTSMHSKIHNALRDKEFIVYYQPQFNIETNSLIGFEALVRWKNSKGEILLPNKFIPLSEELGLVASISNQVLKIVMTQVVKWYKQGIITNKVSVNMAISQIEDNDFIALMKKMLLETSCKAEWLTMEITEGQMMKNPDRAVETLKKLNDLGFLISVDDFGTGHSSLAYLKRFPVHELKIDQSFIADIPNDTDDMLIVEAIIALAKSLDLDIIAEGVETIEQSNFLLSKSCTNMQGYLYAYPLSTDDATKLLVSNQANTNLILKTN